MKRIELENYLKNYLDTKSFNDLCTNGLQVEGENEIKKIAFSVSASMNEIEKAISFGADTLICHHGILWNYQKGLPITGPFGKRVKALIKNNINLLGYHLPLDAHLEIGNAKAIFDLLEMTELKAFGEYRKMPLGVSGKLKPIKASELNKKLSKILNHSIIHSSPDDEQVITSMGIITGGANNEWTFSLEEGLDSYLTGEITEYNWHEAKEAGVHFFAGGHHATEQFGIQQLMNHIKEKFSDLEVKFFNSDNPA